MDDHQAYLFKQTYDLVNPDIPQFDGNITTDTASVTSSIDCKCCDIVSDSTNCDSDYDLDYEEKASQIPVHISQRDILANSLSTLIDPPPWYDEHIPRVINLKQSKQNRKQENEWILTYSLSLKLEVALA